MFYFLLQYIPIVETPRIMDKPWRVTVRDQAQTTMMHANSLMQTGPILARHCVVQYGFSRWINTHGLRSVKFLRSKDKPMLAELCTRIRSLGLVPELAIYNDIEMGPVPN
jgi:hypothetical protein